MVKLCRFETDWLFWFNNLCNPCNLSSASFLITTVSHSPCVFNLYPSTILYDDDTPIYIYLSLYSKAHPFASQITNLLTDFLVWMPHHFPKLKLSKTEVIFPLSCPLPYFSININSATISQSAHARVLGVNKSWTQILVSYPIIVQILPPSTLLHF